MNENYFWPKNASHFPLEVLALLGLNWGMLVTFSC
jgi:hypothetical protein